jgi:hypothetical protein
VTFCELQSELEKIRYPDEVQHISVEITGNGFYPGALGTALSLHMAGGIMLLGQDFGTTEYYRSRIGENDEHCLTWTNTCDTYLKYLVGTHVWCSNYLMGARKPPLLATGDLGNHVKDATQWQNYEEDCWRFLHAQVEYQRPQLIVVMGNPNRQRLSCSSRFATSWDEFSSITEAIASSARTDMAFYTFPLSDGSTHTAAMLLAFHPCYGQGTKKKNLIETDARRVQQVHLSLIEFPSN